MQYIIASYEILKVLNFDNAIWNSIVLKSFFQTQKLQERLMTFDNGVKSKNHFTVERKYHWSPSPLFDFLCRC
jgi:hypothetical protein